MIRGDGNIGHHVPVGGSREQGKGDDENQDEHDHHAFFGADDPGLHRSYQVRRALLHVMQHVFSCYTLHSTPIPIVSSPVPFSFSEAPGLSPGR